MTYTGGNFILKQILINKILNLTCRRTFLFPCQVCITLWRVGGDLPTWAGKVPAPLPCCFPSGPALFSSQQMEEKNKHWAAPAPRITEVGEGWAPVWRRARNQRKPAGDNTLFLFLFFNFLFKGDILGEVKCIRRWTFTNWAPLCNWYPDQKAEHDQPLEGLLVAPSSH